MLQRLEIALRDLSGPVPQNCRIAIRLLLQVLTGQLRVDADTPQHQDADITPVEFFIETKGLKLRCRMKRSQPMQGWVFGAKDVIRHAQETSRRQDKGKTNDQESRGLRKGTGVHGSKIRRRRRRNGSIQERHVG
jgi:hypothetical protein